MVKAITDATFEQETKDGLVLIDFWATWCGPCRMLGPVIEEIATEYEGRVVVGKVDVDSNQDLPAQFRVRNIPTILFIKNGEVQNKLVGAQSKATLIAEAEKLL